MYTHVHVHVCTQHDSYSNAVGVMCFSMSVYTFTLLVQVRELWKSLEEFLSKTVHEVSNTYFYVSVRLYTCINMYIVYTCTCMYIVVYVSL